MSAVLRSAARIRDLNNAFRRTLCGGRRPWRGRASRRGMAPRRSPRVTI